ncbi:maltase 1-like [Aricia agestis]|uniref:maltase 1-like n=1 Tax=Aricia agestis TaxID=91739 RepID=UPI001C202C8D|nr:maltase 1-like [Aricia agestis]
MRAVWITACVLLTAGLVGVLTWAVLLHQRLQVTPPDVQPLDWWEHTIIYQIYPRSFKDSDGDGIGDLKGITSKLQHFVDIGVGAIWMSPIFVSPMVDFGYDVSDFYNIHDEYGTMADFEELVEKAHELGIKVLLDYVPNHASTESEYFTKSVAREPGFENFFVWADPIIDPNNPTNPLVPSNWISQFGGSVWEWNESRQQFYLHQFAIEQADFNFREPAVNQEMMNIMRFWFDKGADGFRVDAIPHLFEANPANHGGVYPDEPLSGNMFLTADQPGYTTQEFTRDQIELYDVVYSWRTFADQYANENNRETIVLLAEAYANVSMTMLYYGDEDSRVGAHFPFNFDFITELSAGSSARDFVYVIKRWLTYMPPGHVANWVFGNHDQKRMPSRFRTDMVDGLNGLNMLLPGVAITYQGEEIGMRDGYVSWEDTVDVAACNQGNPDNYLDYSRDPARTPYHWDNTISAGFSTSPNTWLPVGQDYMEINLQSQLDAPRSHVKVYQLLSALRKEPTLSHGQYHIQALSESTLVLVRHLPTDVVDFGEVTLQAGEALVLRAPPT